MASTARILQSLLWEEVCVFGTGKLIPSTLFIFPYYSKLVVTHMALDYLIQGDTISFDQVFFWLINRGDAFFRDLMSHLGESFEEESLGELSPVYEVSEISSAAISAASSIQVPNEVLSGVLSGVPNQDESFGRLVSERIEELLNPSVVSSMQSVQSMQSMQSMQSTMPSTTLQSPNQHIMFLYFAMNLYATIREECYPEHSIDDLLSPLVQENDTVTRNDLNQALLSFFGVEPNSNRGIVAEIKAFCDLCATLFYFPEDTHCINYFQVVTTITLLEFGMTIDESQALQTLLRQLTNYQESPIIPKYRLEYFLSALAHLLISIPVTSTGVVFSMNSEIQKNIEVMEDQLLTGFLSFGNPINIQDQGLRESILEDQGNVEGIHIKLATTAFSFLFYFISEQKNAKEIMDGLESILETDHPDTLEPVQPTIQQTIVSLLSLQSDSSMALSSEVASFTKEDIAVLKGFSTSYQKAIASSQSSASTCATDSQHVDLFSRDTPMGIFLRVSNHYLLQRSI